MTKFLCWWKRDKRYVTLIKSALLALLPLICCLVYCAGQGRSLGEVYLPESQWNDELFYYKQVESIVGLGYPRGFFGYNESHALKLSFGAWSPVLFFPWILWGLLFGWNLMSPVICNIFLLTLAVFLFVWLVKPSWKQMGILTLFFCLYTPFVRYMLSVMPEVICFSLSILFYALAINYLKRERTYKLVLLFVLSAVMTLMRPYFLLFLLLPAYLWIRKRGWKGALGSLAVIGVTAGVYVAVNHYLVAEYFVPLFDTDWIHAFFEQGLLAGARFTLSKMFYMGRSFLEHMVQGFRTGLASGAFFAGFTACMAVLLAQSFSDFRRLRRLAGEAAREEERRRLKNALVVEVHLVLSFVGMLFALLLLYSFVTDGSKHLLTFIASAAFVIALMETKYFKKAALIGVTFFYFYCYMAASPYDYQAPFVREERVAQLEEWQGLLEARMEPGDSKVPGYENTVMWVYDDVVNGGRVNTEWQLLYALPEGFGISCCMQDYVLEHFDGLQCRYLCVAPGGEIQEKCISAGFVLLAENEKAVLYQRY